MEEKIMLPSFWARHKRKIIIMAIVLVVLLAGIGSFILANRHDGRGGGKSLFGGSEAEQAGRRIAGKCSGKGPGVLSKPAMDQADFSHIIPYGLMVGGHVTPIDHQYFSPADYKSPRDAYPVYAMGDARLVQIQHRVQGGNDNDTVRSRITDEWRLVFTQSCTFMYYYDLVTSLTPEIKAEFEKNRRGDNYAQVDIPVKAGQLIGRIGSQTLDFAVWDTQKPLKGFVNPASYENEPWKLYTADPLDYYTPELKALMLAKYARTAPPISGQIDYDIDGKLRGSWFEEGKTQKDMHDWTIEVSFSPDHYDPSHFMISMGLYDKDAKQFYARGNAPDPATVSPASGLVKYELVQGRYVLPDGSQWSQMTLAKGARVQLQSHAAGVVLVQMLEGRKLKFEAFPGKTAAQVSAFTPAAKVYTR
ncbi:MAG TPA: hypothetical protein VNA68_01810 [Candidatus Dormibacteraeota bacterium]|nr:hypothetical protein [Candidatus Dormibacteraeota bacterium]